MKKRKIVALACAAAVLLLAVLAFWYVQTKLDKINRSQIQKQVKLIRNGLGMEKDDVIIPFSAASKQGREEIWALIEKMAAGEEKEQEEGSGENEQA